MGDLTESRPVESFNNNNLDEKIDTPTKKGKTVVFKEKVFKERESLLTVLFRETEANVALNFVCAVFVLFFIRATFDDIFVHGIPFYHTWLIWWNFEHFPLTMIVWSAMFASTFIPYFVMKLWSIIPAKTVTLNGQLPMIGSLLLYYSLFFHYALRFLFHMELNCACSFIITCESTRLAMKVYSFVRENAPRSMDNKLVTQMGSRNFEWPSVNQYVYFMFCPSFIYRDQYPRSSTRDLRVAGLYFVKCLLIIECVNLTFTQYVQPWLSSVNYSRQSTTETVISLFAAIVPGILCLLCLFFGLLHCWLNCFSEFMQFADRQFYLNWWNSNNMAEYYRNWNLVVHDWLYAYVYKDVAQLVGGRKGLLVSQTCVFFLSAVFHEYWFGIAFRVFYPVMFMLYFVFGGIFFLVSRSIKNKAVWNTALWFNLLIGTGMFVAFYGQEWYARTRCSQNSTPMRDALLPRHWTCA